MEFQSFGGVHGHQLHRVVRYFLIQANVAAGFVEISEMFDEVAELGLFAFAFPFLDEIHEAIEVVAILIGRQRSELEASD